jgi:hypothetical protein
MSWFGSYMDTKWIKIVILCCMYIIILVCILFCIAGYFLVVQLKEFFTSSDSIKNKTRLFVTEDDEIDSDTTLCENNVETPLEIITLVTLSKRRMKREKVIEKE